jgi:hypothetical protein
MSGLASLAPSPIDLPNPLTPDTHLRTSQALRYLREHHNYHVGDTTLPSLRSKGGGPVFYAAGKVVTYTVRDLDSWVAEKRARPFTSTADRRARRMAGAGFS